MSDTTEETGVLLCHAVSKITVHHDTSRDMIDTLTKYDLHPAKVLYVDTKGRKEALPIT